MRMMMRGMWCSVEVIFAVYITALSKEDNNLILNLQYMQRSDIPSLGIFLSRFDIHVNL